MTTTRCVPVPELFCRLARRLAYLLGHLTFPHERPAPVGPPLISSTRAGPQHYPDTPTTNYSTIWQLSVGTTSAAAVRSLLSFPLGAVPANTSLSSASLRLYYDTLILPHRRQ